MADVRKYPVLLVPHHDGGVPQHGGGLNGPAPAAVISFPLVSDPDMGNRLCDWAE